MDNDDPYNYAGEKADDVLPLGKFFDTQSDAALLNRLVVIKSGIGDFADDTIVFFKDPETSALYFAVGDASGWTEPGAELYGLTGIQHMRFERIHHKAHIEDAGYYLYQVSPIPSLRK